jgi:CheY-like chemotaxis protein
MGQTGPGYVARAAERGERMPQRCVLVVDDDEAVREIAQASLEAIGGWRVLTASGGTQGWERAVRDRPDAILLDVLMPGMDGADTVARLQAEAGTREIPVVLLTAGVQPRERAAFAELPGVSGVIAKPFDPMLLARQVGELLGWTDTPPDSG